MLAMHERSLVSGTVGERVVVVGPSIVGIIGTVQLEQRKIRVHRDCCSR